MEVTETMSQTAGVAYLEQLAAASQTDTDAQVAQTSSNTNFHNTLQEMVRDIDSMQKQLTDSITHLDDDPALISSKMQAADSTYDMMMGIKSRLMNAYQAISSSPHAG